MQFEFEGILRLFFIFFIFVLPITIFLICNEKCILQVHYATFGSLVLKNKTACIFVVCRMCNIVTPTNQFDGLNFKYNTFFNCTL